MHRFKPVFFRVVGGPGPLAVQTDDAESDALSMIVIVTFLLASLEKSVSFRSGAIGIGCATALAEPVVTFTAGSAKVQVGITFNPSRAPERLPQDFLRHRWVSSRFQDGRNRS